MTDWAVVLNILGIFIESLAVVVSLRKLLFFKNEIEVSDAKFEQEKRDLKFTIFFIFLGMSLQIAAVLIEANSQ